MLMEVINVVYQLPEVYRFDIQFHEKSLNYVVLHVQFCTTCMVWSDLLVAKVNIILLLYLSLYRTD